MSSPKSRLKAVLSHLPPNQSTQVRKLNYHALSPTIFLPRAAQIEPLAIAIHHVSIDGVLVRRTYREFADRACGLAYFFLKYAYRRIGILAPNTPAFLESIFAIGAAGGIHVGANYRLKPEELAYIFAFAEVDCIVVDAQYKSLLQLFLKKHPNVHIIIDTDNSQVIGDSVNSYENSIREGTLWDAQTGNNGWNNLSVHTVDEDSCIAVPFTSGTTARPKGVVFTHRGAYLAALSNVIESGLILENRKRCGYLWTLPMFHAVGWTFPWAVTAARGTHYCLRKIDYTVIWNLLKSEPITHFNAAPTVNTFLCASKDAICLPTPVRVTVAASPPTPYLLQRMTEINLIPIHVYGMTETYGPITKNYYKPEWNSLPSQEKYARMARQGYGFITSLPIRIIRTDQPDDVLIDVQKNGQEIGEIVFMGNNCAKEYLNDPEATKKLWAGGVLHSGDLAVWHSDGSAQILDRKKDIIISGGENISSVALESMLARHPAILEAAVVGVPDSEWGERPVAFIICKESSEILKPLAVSSPPSISRDILEWAKKESSISRFMMPREIHIVTSLPKTSSGKVKKNLLRKWAVGDVNT
ncbi:Acetate/butyrate--CoA ligase AAE7, peroxisomal [Erysiphe necator]|uniref:Putative amp-binding enzyme n=1 Tax=Uncinula necator TaxID=52586 RepID=A0A0B1P8I4_UNCNE|nr:Acetate/butyrate--CoA ligase AAE7, peroxisomal [Erysiphe necator]KHJ35007.1 putative amp-binding enzyme [Erysiphe necator]